MTTNKKASNKKGSRNWCNELKKKDPVRYEEYRAKRRVSTKSYNERVRNGIIPEPKTWRKSYDRMSPASLKVILASHKERQQRLRKEFEDLHGNKCRDCPATEKLMIRHTGGLRNHQGTFAFQPVSMLSKEKRDVILKDCILLCWKCANSIYKKENTLL